MDTGVMGEPAGVTPDIPAREVAIAGGRSLAQLRSAGDRGEAVDVMIEGVSKLTPQLYDERRFRSEEHTSELQSRGHLVCRLLLEKKKNDGRSRRMIER